MCDVDKLKNYYVIKNDVDKHECIKKYIFEKIWILIYPYYNHLKKHRIFRKRFHVRGSVSII